MVCYVLYLLFIHPINISCNASIMNIEYDMLIDSPITGPTLFDRLGETEYKTRFLAPKWQYALLFHFFVLLWMMYFISYHTYLVVCGVK